MTHVKGERDRKLFSGYFVYSGYQKRILSIHIPSENSFSPV